MMHMTIQKTAPKFLNIDDQIWLMRPSTWRLFHKFRLVIDHEISFNKHVKAFFVPPIVAEYIGKLIQCAMQSKNNSVRDLLNEFG